MKRVILVLFMVLGLGACTSFVDHRDLMGKKITDKIPLGVSELGFYGKKILLEDDPKIRRCKFYEYKATGTVLTDKCAEWCNADGSPKDPKYEYECHNYIEKIEAEEGGRRFYVHYKYFGKGDARCHYSILVMPDGLIKDWRFEGLNKEKPKAGCTLY